MFLAPKYVRLPMFIILVAIVTGVLTSCKVELYQVQFIDKDGAPIPNVLVVLTQYRMPFGRPRVYICRSGTNGVVELPAKNSSTCEAGCIGYYPEDVYVSGKGNEIVVLSRHPDNSSLLGIIEYLCLRGAIPMTTATFVDSPLWKEWGDYLITLESNGYFKSSTVLSTNRYF